MNEKYVLVTGACGGLGAAAASELARRGFKVIAADIAEPKAGEGILPLVMDVSDEASVEAAAKAVAQITPKLYAVLHLAGVYTMDSFVEIDESGLSQMLAVNLMGVYRVNKAFLPLLLAARGNALPRIAVVTSELAPLDPLPFNGIYSMTKTALESYAHSLALELELVGIRVVTLRPGAFGSGMPQASLREMERMSRTTKLYPKVTARFRSIMLGEIGSAKDPAVFAEWVAGILQKKRPRLLYAKNNSLKLKLFSALPFPWQAALLKKLLGAK